MVRVRVRVRLRVRLIRVVRSRGWTIIASFIHSRALTITLTRTLTAPL